VPTSEIVIKTCQLGGGLQASLIDGTSHYYGGYYHVRILINAEVPVCSSAFTGAAEHQDAIRRLGNSIKFKRILEKMAVPEGELDVVRQHLLTSFDSTMLPYLQREDFADSFVQSEYRKALKSRAAVRR